MTATAPNPDPPYVLALLSHHHRGIAKGWRAAAQQISESHRMATVRDSVMYALLRSAEADAVADDYAAQFHGTMPDEIAAQREWPVIRRKG